MLFADGRLHKAVKVQADLVSGRVLARCSASRSNTGARRGWAPVEPSAQLAGQTVVVSRLAVLCAVGRPAMAERPVRPASAWR